MTTDKAGPSIPLRRLLRTLEGVELWHVEDRRKHGQRTLTVQYVVKSGGSEKTFDRPHEAWRHFQQLTNAPDKDTRAEPPPIDLSILSTTPKSRKTRRRRRRSSS